MRSKTTFDEFEAIGATAPPATQYIRCWPTYEHLLSWFLWHKIETTCSLSPTYFKSCIDEFRNTSPVLLHCQLYNQYNDFRMMHYPHDYTGKPE